MKKSFLFLIMYIMSNCISAQLYTKTVKRNNEFAFDFYKQIFKENSNTLFSPYSISSALAMTYAGARGNTEKQIANVLNYDSDQEKTHKGFWLLNEHFKNYKSDTVTALYIANALWKDENWWFKKDFLDLTQEYYDAAINPLTTADEINKWVRNNTNNKIKEIVSDSDLNNVRMVLTNAVYFKGNWLKKFKVENTKKDKFLNSEVEMMYQKGRFTYFEDEENQVLELPYENKKVSMIIILPKENSDIIHLKNIIDRRMYDYYTNSLHSAEVNVYLPIFEINTDYYLKDHLVDMGMVDAFDAASANFTGMSNGISLSSVKHKAFIEVNEEGTEAAAVTAVFFIERSANRPEPITFKADRPFMFIIKENETGSILFIGILINPLE